jgi:hypothetical protein
MGTAPERFPCKPGDWVSDGGQIARVKSVDWDGAEVVVDLFIYNRDGDNIGRTSPVLGGPRTYEPCCPWRYWHRVPEPEFPLRLVEVPIPGTDRVKVDWDFGAPLPELAWKRPVRRSRGTTRVHDDEALEALRKIASGHNDARGLAQSILNRGARP